jgi:type I restriction enzyme S subunit
MSFRPYASYRKSGVKFLTEVPTHWGMSPLKWLTDPKRPIMYGIVLPGPDVVEGIPILKGGNVKPSRMNLQSMARTTPEIEAPYARARLKTGDLVYSIRGSIGDCELVPPELDGSNITQDVARIAVADGICAPWARWALLAPAIREDLASGSLGAAVRGINIFDLKRASIPVPPPNEQLKIAQFLDRETAEIDALVAEQRRLVELLKEEHQASMARLITRGLNPDAPMTHSGIDWIGDVPAHWQVIPLKRLIAQNTSISYGIVQPGEPLDDGVPFVQTANMKDGDFDPQSLQKTSADIAALYPRTRLAGGEVILGIRASIGASHVVPANLVGANLSRGVARIVPNSQLISAYLVAYFESDAVRQYWNLTKQGSTFSEVSIETVRELAVCVPPIQEQHDIARVAHQKAQTAAALSAETERAIDFLVERRAALISAAVKGDIDVRGFTTSGPT